MEFFYTHIAPQALEYAIETLRSGWVSEGAKVRTFEAALSEVLGLRNPVAVNSGTAALHLALVLAGVGPGDEVILPAQTFVATGLAILMQRATPVFADINPKTGNIAPSSVQERLTPRTKAIVPVHWGGYPCDLDEINAIAAHHGVAVIEDAAHALGAVYRGTPVGAISRFTAFSFQAIKHVTAGDGGALCCRDPLEREKGATLRWFAIDRANSRPSLLGERVFDITEVGYKYHMNDLAAAVGLGNLEDFSARLRRRREIAARYRVELADTTGVRLLESSTDRHHAYWLFTVLAERREDFVRKLASLGIPTSVVHKRIDRYAVFGGERKDLPGQSHFEAQQISIPVHEHLKDEDVEAIIRIVRAGW